MSRFSAFDANTRVQSQEELLRIKEQNRKVFLFVVHSLDEAIYLAFKIIFCLPKKQIIK